MAPGCIIKRSDISTAESNSAERLQLVDQIPTTARLQREFLMTLQEEVIEIIENIRFPEAWSLDILMFGPT